MLDQRLLLSLPLASKTNQNNRRGGLTMTKKKTLKNWLLTITFSCIVICFIDLLFHQRLDRMFIIAWSISYTLFYFIRNREIIFKKSNQDWSIYIKKATIKELYENILCHLLIFFLTVLPKISCAARHAPGFSWFWTDALRETYLQSVFFVIQSYKEF